MGADLLKSVVLIRGSDPTRFGTGFVIFRSDQATFLLTCMHVVEDVGGSEVVRIGNGQATLVASDETKGFDLAVLRVNEALEAPPLKLLSSGGEEEDFTAVGFHTVGKKTVSQEVTGKLHGQVGLESQSLGSAKAWYLEIPGVEEAQGRSLLPGYSGGPVLDKQYRVIGVVSVSQDEGKRGLAIDISALKLVWADMPPGLIAHQPEARFKQIEPVMNLEEELDAFKKIVAGDDPHTRVILVSGEGGMGKTHLIELYRRVAQANQVDYLDLPLGPQMSVEECIQRIIRRVGGFSKFPRYDEYRSENSKPDTRKGEEEWLSNLTRKVFMDLESCNRVKQLILFFDQYEKADPAFKKWLGEVFLPYINRPLTVVVAGREACLASLRERREFYLNGVEVKWFYQYCEACKIKLNSDLIETLHTALRGRPKEFVEYLKTAAVRESV